MPYTIGNQGKVNTEPANQALPVAQYPATTSVHTPAVATQATITKAAGSGGVRHVAVGVIGTIACGATAQTPILAHLRDGAAGTGAILASWALAAPANGFAFIPPLAAPIWGSANTGLTLEFAGAGVANSQQSVTLETVQIS